MKDALFISFEGGEGVGKSTQVRLLAARLTQAGYEVCCLREPGGTKIGEQIRQVLLDPANEGMAPLAELLLYEAARAQLVAEVISPALEAGKIVLLDRFTDSTIAYQAFARGLDRALVDAANTLGSEALTPQRTILLKQDMDTGLSKAISDGADRVEAEGREFHKRVHEGFEHLAQQYPERIVTVNCQEKKEDTHELLFAAVADLLDERTQAPFSMSEHLLSENRDNK